MIDLRTAAQQALEALEAMQSYAAAERKGLRICDEAITTLRAALAEPVQEPSPPQRKPLAEWQITDLMADIDPEDVCSWSFRQGVYAAEKHHGVRP